ncbi:MAG: cupin domain-containing protein [Gemmatimonadetes bacterium]|nr:cupin domain-containing protein [Gemmatimonadota bacterium]MBT6148699.1 cupin domain-containing protein [Gemmatimonadota bacterium]MBT7861160.1 cupin domain-containing protein [Gemmatimonadota bacterium]
MHAQLDEAFSAPATELLVGVEHQTPWTALRCVELSDGKSVDVAGDDEAVLLLLRGEVVTSQEAHLKAPALVRAAARPAVLRAQGSARLLCAHVRLTTSDETTPACDGLNPEALTWRDAIHGGGGRIATRHVWRGEDFAGTAWVYVDHAILGTHSSLGHHYHEAGEEVFVVLEGQGRMTVGDSTFDVGPGSVTYQPIGVGHGLYNPHDEDLVFVRLAVGIPGEVFTTIDLDDDLRTRQTGAKS